jgi:uncharacterized protein (TIGR03067 family)
MARVPEFETCEFERRRVIYGAGGSKSLDLPTMTSLTLSLALCVLAPAPKEAPKKESSIIGDWKVEMLQIGGAILPLMNLEDSIYTFSQEGELFVKLKKGNTERGKYKLNLKNSPHEIDLIDERDGMEKTRPGIFKIEADVLILCVDEQRPTKLESPAGSETILLKCKRIKKD